MKWTPYVKPHVVFVDEDLTVLDHLRQQLMPQADAWGMIFAPGAEDALMVLEDKPVDVVISRNTLSGMGGVRLLERVRSLQPRASRILMGGAELKDQVLSVVGPVHQVVDGSDINSIVDCLDRLLRMQATLDRPKLRKLVSGVESLPTPSDSYYKLIDLLDRDDASAKEVGELVSQEMAMSAQLLKLTNSAMFALPTPVTNASHAVQVLGFDVVRRVALLAGVFELFEGTAEVQSNITRLGQNSLGIGQLCGEISRMENLPSDVVAQAECAGLMAHLGMLLLLSEYGDQYLETLKLIDEDGVTIIEAERMAYGASHAEVGAYLLGLWGFAIPIVEAVAFHHEPLLLQGDALSASGVLHAAQFLATPRAVQGSSSEEIAGLLNDGVNVAYFEELGITHRLIAWRQKADEMRTAGTLR
ncbi:MAG: HDOD domain-containing protein [Parvibaculaceae bacterium]|nr:HDOD domain-containing protein [Parvibaculaceae bacterium]